MAKRQSEVKPKSLPAPTDAGEEITADEAAAREQTWHPRNVNERFQRSGALTSPRDALHLLSTSFRKAAEAMNKGLSVARALESVAEEIEDIAAEAEAIAPSAS